MANKRQRSARKRFKEANPDLFPKPQPSTGDPSSKKHEKVVKKITKSKPNSFKSSKSKHPLRVPGMKPGEGCFICKSNDHIAKLCPQKSQWENNKICLLCRHRGHSLKNCPEKSEGAEKKFCYNCGEAGHDLSKCPLPLQDGGTKFANCFICHERGHLSKHCPKNTHGIYPKGGCCKVCGGVTHLAKDCPNRGNRNPISSMVASGDVKGSATGKRTVFNSGDDIEDDFMVEDDKNTKNVESKVENGVDVQSKKRQGPKVVNFCG